MAHHGTHHGCLMAAWAPRALAWCNLGSAWALPQMALVRYCWGAAYGLPPRSVWRAPPTLSLLKHTRGP
eukprot:5340837-Lingulodinium_polyedra.AAC.1